jgi:probable F420-dependent oxidoreductase
MARKFRFGVNFVQAAPGEEWDAKCRRAEELGYDVLLVADHLGMAAPFPSLVAASRVTEHVRLGTFVLNAAFWNPTLLAREVATVDLLTGGRLELGLGAGYVRSEFEAAGLDFGTPGSRVDRLERAVTELDRLLADDEGFQPKPVQRPRPPLLIGGAGRRVLRLAARHAATIAFTGAEPVPGSTDGAIRLADADRLAEQVATARRYAEEYGTTDPELNVLVQRVVTTDDREAAANELRPHAPHLTSERLLELPTLLIGTVKEIADQVRAHRERFGITYITVLEPDLESFAPVIEMLRHDEH